MESKVLIALIDSLVDEAISKVIIPQGEKGLRGLKGKDGNDFNLLDHEEAIRSFVIQNIPEFKLTEEQIISLKGTPGKDGKSFNLEDHSEVLKSFVIENIPEFKLTEEQIISLKGESGKDGIDGKDGVDGKDGLDFNLEDCKDKINEIINKYIYEISPSLKLSFEDLTEEDKDVLRGPRGQRGKPGKDFDLEESKEFIESSIADSVMALAPDLKLKFEDLSDIDKSSLKLKFSDLTNEEVNSLKGSRGQRGKQGIQGEKGIQGENGIQGEQGKIGQIGPRGMPGLQGLTGAQGRDGKDGKDAPIVTDVKVDQDPKNKDFSLIFEMSDGTEVESEKIELPKGDTIFYYPAGFSGGNGGSGGGTGPQGPEGKSAYEVAVENGFVGTEVQWLESLVGEQGIQGIQGEQGIQGIQGEQGIQGIQGEPGTFDPTLFLETGEPTGFVNRVDSFIEFNELDRRFVIGPTATSFVVYVLGTRIEITETLSRVIPNESGNYYFYIDSLGQLQFIQTFNIFLITSVAYCGYLYFDAEDGKAVSIGDERHGITMDSATHKNLHTTRGTQLVSGADIAYSLGNGNLDLHAKVSLSNMKIADEDIEVTITNSASPVNNFEQVLDPYAKLPIMYRQGAIWKTTVSTEFPLIPGTIRAKYNNYNGTGWQLTEAPSNNKVLVTYVFATTSIINPVIGILGQAEYQNIAEAKLLAAWEAIDFGDLPSPEMKLLYILYYETSSTYDNSVNSRIVFVEDCRYNYDKPVSSAALNDNHSTLLNLDADDHPQYLNETRGDARYYTQAEIDLIVDSLTLGVGVTVTSNGTILSDHANLLNFSSDSFEIETVSHMEDWQYLSDVFPGLSTYNSPLVSEVDIKVKDPYLLKNYSCDNSVYAGAYVRINGLGIAVNALADSKQNSKVLGMVESKIGNTVCDIRIKGISSFIASGLDVEEDYWLSPTIPGARTTIKPSGSGQYIINLGQALSDSSLFVDIGTRLQIP